MLIGAMGRTITIIWLLAAAGLLTLAAELLAGAANSIRIGRAHFRH
jgi:hypothetical protein